MFDSIYLNIVIVFSGQPPASIHISGDFGDAIINLVVYLGHSSVLDEKVNALMILHHRPGNPNRGYAYT